MSAYRKYFAASDAVDRLQSEVLDDLRPIGERYGLLLHRLRKEQGQWCRDHFPASVDGMREDRDGIYVYGTWTRRGCTDNESITIPNALVYADEAGREAFFADMQAQIDAQIAANGAEEEAEERAELERLKERFPD